MGNHTQDVEEVVNEIEDDLEDQRSFNWEKDEGDSVCNNDSSGVESLHLRKHKRKSWANVHPFLRLIALLLIGVACFATPAIVIAKLADPGRIRFRNRVMEPQDNVPNFLVWLFTWLAFSWGMMALTDYFVSIMPRFVVRASILFTGKCSEVVKSRLEYYAAMQLWIKLILVLTWALASFNFIFMYGITDKIWDANSTWQVTTFRILISLEVASLVFFLEKLCIQLIAIKFHRVAYRDRIKENKYALWVLDRLSGARRNGDAIDTATHKQTKVLAGMVEKVNSGALFSNGGDLTKGLMANQEDDINSNHQAKKLAKKLFAALQHNRQELVMSDFLPYFSSHAEAEKAFNVFDRDGNGDISKWEMKTMILRIYQERRNLVNSLRDVSHAVGKLDKMFMVISVFIIAIIISVVFGGDLIKTLVPLGTTFLGLSFVFGGSAKNVFESIIFLFVTHPFDAGDRVFIDEQNLVVHNMGILTTVFLRVDGQMMYAPNSVLATKYIYNWRRSGGQCEIIPLVIDFHTPQAKVDELRRRVQEFTTQDSRVFNPTQTINLVSIDKVNGIELGALIDYKFNWQDGGKRWETRNKFMFKLRHILMELSISYSMPSQPIHHLNSQLIAPASDSASPVGRVFHSLSENSQLSVQPPSRFDRVPSSNSIGRGAPSIGPPGYEDSNEE